LTIHRNNENKISEKSLIEHGTTIMINKKSKCFYFIVSTITIYLISSMVLDNDVFALENPFAETISICFLPFQGIESNSSQFNNIHKRIAQDLVKSDDFKYKISIPKDKELEDDLSKGFFSKNPVNKYWRDKGIMYIVFGTYGNYITDRKEFFLEMNIYDVQFDAIGKEVKFNKIILSEYNELKNRITNIIIEFLYRNHSGKELIRLLN
jgi:hypothetical protein